MLPNPSGRCFAISLVPVRYDDIEPFTVDTELKERGLYKKIVSGKELSLQELGKILEVDAVISGEVTSFGKTFALHLL